MAAAHKGTGPSVRSARLVPLEQMTLSPHILVYSSCQSSGAQERPKPWQEVFG